MGIKLVIAVVAGLTAGVAALSRSWWQSKSQVDAYQAARIVARGVFEAEPVRPIALQDEQFEHELRGVVLGATEGIEGFGADRKASELREQLASDVASFLTLRWGGVDLAWGSDPTASEAARARAFVSYKNWREKSGAVLREDAEFDAKWGITESYKLLLGASAKADASLSEMYEACWQRADQWGAGACVPRLVDGARVQVRVTRLNPMDPVKEQFAGELGAAIHNAKSVTNTRGWWSSPRPLKKRLAAGERPMVASVAMLMEFPGGLRRPVIVDFLRDEERSVWQLDQVVVAEWPSDRPFAWEF